MPTPSIRLYTDRPLQAEAAVSLSQAQAHYLRDVMRCKTGDTVALFNGQDGEWQAAITQLAKKTAELTLRAQLREQRPEPDLWLCFAPIKHGRIDYLAQKATELGVSRLQPVITQHTIARRVNGERLQANAIEAAEQSERLSVPEVLDPVSLAALLQSWPEQQRVLCWCDEAGSGVPVGHIAERLQPGTKLALLIGPEGGFSAAERQAIAAIEGVQPIGLGPRVMRADTAAIAALACIQSQLGDWDQAPAFREG